jgi:hypothetical protein
MVLVSKGKGERPLGRPRSMWEDNNKIDLRVLGLVGMYWIDLM